MKPILLLSLFLLLGGCAHHINAPDKPTPVPETGWQVDRGVVYTPEDWPEALKADVYRPGNAGLHPAVLVVHGGSWKSYSRSGMDGFAEELAERGFVVMNINYRLVPDYLFPAQLHDLQQAMHWLHHEAARLHVDTENIGAFGYSAGAHLVSLLAVVASNPDSELNTPYGGPETRLSAVVAGGLPSDLRKFGSGKIVRQFLGARMEDRPELYAQASPITHITNDAPPFFLFHGAWDGLVPVDHATDFQAALASRGVFAEMMLLRFRGHALSYLFNGSAMDAAIDFLGRNLQSTE